MATSHIGWLSLEQTVVEPHAFAAEIGVDRTLLCFTEGFYHLLVNAFGLRDATPAPPLAGALEGRSNGKVAVYRSSFGAPAAGMLMEALVASNVRQFLMVGEAGSITPRCRIGDLFLPTWGVREEGTSYHYLPPGAACGVSSALLNRLRATLTGLPVVEGGIWTTDAPFRETRDKVRAHARDGVMAVEMECTALMAIAAYRGVEFAAVMVITDELFGQAWVQGFDAREVQRARELLCERLAGGFSQG